MPHISSGDGASLSDRGYDSRQKLEDLETARILVVEDDMLSAWSLRETLEEFGCKVVGITDTAQAAARYVAEFETDIVLIDVQLRGERDGIDAAEQIRRHSNAAIIFVSGASDAATMDRANAVQPVAFVVKPYVEGQLKRAIADAAARRR